jgi:hypothetical protein
MNTIANCPVTTSDVDLAEKIYGKDIASITGKTTRRKPSPAVQNMVNIPPELINAQRNVDLCFDTVFINGTQKMRMEKKVTIIKRMMMMEKKVTIIKRMMMMHHMMT